MTKEERNERKSLVERWMEQKRDCLLDFLLFDRSD